jgi:3-oxoacyl-[acyl-carrier-protein] synthase II
MDKQRVVVTGLGVVAPNGIGKEAYWSALMEGRNAVGRITRFDTSRFSTKIGGEIKNFEPHKRIPREHLAHMDRSSQMGVTAALQAVEDSGLDPCEVDVNRWGVYMGIAVAGVDGYENDFCHWRRKGVENVQRNWYQGWFPSACSGYISLILGLRGNSHVLSTGCCSSVDAMGLALDAIRTGEEEIALAGGTEAPLTPLGLSAFCSMRALSTRNEDPEHASRPFDNERDGFVLAEGSAVVVLESLAHARQRGATIYAELKGYGTTSNAFHMTAPEPSGDQPARAFRLALKDADMSPEDIDVVMAHGSSTPLNEKAETKAAKKAFGSHAYKLAIPSIKSMIGHSLGSAGLLQSVASVLALVHQKVPPTINYEFPDPDCDLDCVPNTARSMRVRAVLSNSAGFSGKNTAVVFQELRA